MALGVPVVGVDEMSKTNPRFEEQLKDVEAVSDESLEKIIELQPDLIIGLSDIKNIDKFKQIAPTVTYTYNKVDYLTQQLEVGKLVNKEKEAQAWVDDFSARTKKRVRKSERRSARMQLSLSLKPSISNCMYTGITLAAELNSSMGTSSSICRRQ